MTRFIFAAAIAASSFSTAAVAGSLADPVVEPAIIVADATSSSSGKTQVALLALILAIGVAAD